MWGVGLVIAAFVLSLVFFGGWIVAVPLAIIGGILVWLTRSIGAKRDRDRDREGVSRLREQSRGAGPRDEGGVEFTDRDRETLS